MRYMENAKVRIVKADKKEAPDAEQIAACADALALYRSDHHQAMDKDLAKMIGNLPSRYRILREQDPVSLGILFDTIAYIWRKVTGKDVRDLVEAPASKSSELDGCYWLLPGGLMIGGLNHFAAAKRHRGVICALLGIDRFDFERCMARKPDEVIGLIVSKGGVRVLVKRSDSSVFMQATESSWPVAKRKISKLPHKVRTVKIVDLSVPYAGWSSGIPVSVK